MILANKYKKSDYIQAKNSLLCITTIVFSNNMHLQGMSSYTNLGTQYTDGSRGGNMLRLHMIPHCGQVRSVVGAVLAIEHLVCALPELTLDDFIHIQ